MQKVTVTPLADVTSIMTGTTCNWFWEVTEVYVSGVANAFTWVDGLLTVTGYTSGTVLVEFTLYILYDAPSQYFPKDPTNPLSDEVYWENRLRNFISVSVGIRSFETGLTDIGVGNISIEIDDDWIGLIQQNVIFANRTVRIYTDDVISFKGISTRSSVSGYSLSINVQKRQTILESELTWGDAKYLNRVDRSNNDSYYNGANIPTQYEGFAIPMLFGDQTPYELNREGEVDLGNSNPALFTAPISNKRPAIGLSTNSVCVRVIPTSTTGGILGKMPVYQTIGSTPISVTMTGRGASTFIKAAQANNSVITGKMIPGEVAIMDRVAPGAISPCRYYNFSGTTGSFLLGVDDTSATFALYDTLQSCDEKIHCFPSQIPTANWTGAAILSSTTTPAGHRWLTVSGLTGIDLYQTDLYIVLTEITGEKTAPEVLQFAMEYHGFTVDESTFDAAAIAFPYKTIQQAGFGNNLPTLANFVSEINRSLMTVLVFPASNDVPFLKIIDPTEASTQTLDERQITNLSWSSEYRDQAKNVIFRPKYAQSDAFKASLYLNQPATRAELFSSEKTLELEHVLAEVPTRFEEMTEIYGSPVTTVSFTLLDDEATLEIADVVYIDHSQFQQKIIVTNIQTTPIGRAIQGRYLYVN